MARIDTSVQIAAPAEVVYAFFVPQRMPYWYGADMQASFEVQDDASDFAVAQKVQITGNLGKREVSHTAIVTAVQQARLFEWRFSDPHVGQRPGAGERGRAAPPSPHRPPQAVLRGGGSYPNTRLACQ